ncbi:MAG: DUF58 domain-containing protein [Spirochaetaceae bacterium]|jgi:hypothetical protein|nr:DUF58 domain-containing protein [Spirochaetaceae bacterium]
MAFSDRIFFTPAGAAAGAAALVVLVRALSSRNVYEIALGAAALGCGAALLFTGIWRSRRLAGLEPAWKPPSPCRANSGAGMPVAGFGAKAPPPFFRLHFVVKGRFYPAASDRSAPVRAETSLPRGADTATVHLDFPLSGLFRGRGACRLRDVFGLFSFPCGTAPERVFAVRSGPCAKRGVPLRAYSGAEDRRVKNADEERYYMREYAPGDRFRDINWKTSERIDLLVTRISPDNQEKINRIEVRFRNFGPAGPEASLGDLWLLDRAKARLARFLRTVTEEEAGGYVFAVQAAQESWEIRSDEELEAFLERLAALPFAAPRNEDPPAPGENGALYVFSTACDAGLPGFLLARQTRLAALFLVRFRRGKRGKDGKEAKEAKEKSETLFIKDFLARGFRPLPRWFLPYRERDVSVPAIPGCRVEIEYGEVRL